MIGYTYFARVVGDRSRVKIGRSSAPLCRTREMGYQLKAKVELVAAVPGEKYELRFHALFAEYHEGREWFTWSPIIERTIESILLGRFDAEKLPPPRCLTRPLRQSTPDAQPTTPTPDQTQKAA